MSEENTAERQQKIGSQDQAFAYILEWLRKHSMWQYEALRRLRAKGELSDSDLKELAVLCKNEDDKSDVLPAKEHTLKTERAAKAIVLRKIRNAEGINALKEKQCLTFEKEGLTVVYGDNGSGKSGYVRILKEVCRVRTLSPDEKILQNVYELPKDSQRATIDFSDAGDKKSVPYNWISGETKDTPLRLISVFDNGAGDAYIKGKKNKDTYYELAYTPFPLRMLERLVEACKDVKEILNKEIEELDRKKSEEIPNLKCHKGAKVHELIAEIKSKEKKPKANSSLISSVHELATLRDDEERQLEELRENPNRKDQKRQLDGYAGELKKWYDAVSGQKLEHLDKLYKAEDTDDTAFFENLLPDTGSTAWRELWGAAKLYSEQHAYQGKPFPFAGDAAQCVLCQQKLEAEAIKRFADFKNFVKGKIEQQGDGKETYQDKRKLLPNHGTVSDKIEAMVKLIDEELKDNDLVESLKCATETLLRRLHAIHERYGDAIQEKVAIPEIKPWPEEKVAALSAKLEGLHNGDDTQRKELEGRKWLAGVKEAVIAWIKERGKLEEALTRTKGKPITDMSGKISEYLVTKALRKRLSEEVKKFGLDKIKIELRGKGEDGKRFTSLHLKQKGSNNHPVNRILSEGEQHCITLAAFFTDLATEDSQSAIVFDDPVSSLDHGYRELVARRFAEEGKSRQVIVFTHDAAFLSFLEYECKGKKTRIAYRGMFCNDDHAGWVQKDSPMRVQPICKKIESMGRMYEKMKRLHEDGKQNEWEGKAKELAVELRSAWEGAVARVVAPVIKRFSNKVDTSNFDKLTVLGKEDYEKMRKAYGECSAHVHNQSKALNKPLPPPSWFCEQIHVLRTWTKKIEKLQEKIEKKRKKTKRAADSSNPPVKAHID